MALLHQILQDAIANSGLNKGDFAKACGLSRTSLFHILNGTSLPKKPTLNRISKVLKKDQKFLKHLDQLYQSELLQKFNSRSKVVKTEQEHFRARLFSKIKRKFDCSVEESRIPDFWVNSNSVEVPVFAEMRITEPYNLLGRAQSLYAKSERITKIFACVSVANSIHETYKQIFATSNLEIVTSDHLIRELNQIFGRKTSTVSGHFMVDISMD